jgi:hypothetical protein
VFSSGGSLNLLIDELGRARSIEGYTKQNAAAITTNTGASATMIRSLIPFRSTASGTVSRSLIGAFDDGVDEWELWKSTDSGVNWSFLADLGSGSIGRIADGAQYGQSLYLTNGVMAPRKWDGTTLSTAGLTQSPTPTATEASGNGNLNGNYKYKLVSRKNDGTRAMGSVASSEVPVTDKKIDLSWTADADTSVVGYEIYRTTGTSGTFFFVTFSDGRTSPTTFSDNIPDTVILANRALAEHGDAPPSGSYYVEAHKDRVWWGRTDTYPWRVWYSDIGLPESVGLLSYLNLADNQITGDTLTGLVGEYEGRLIAFTERAVWSISGSGALINGIVDFTRRRTNASIGTVSGRTVVRVPSGAKYLNESAGFEVTEKVSLVYLTPHKDIRIFDGTNDFIISDPIADTLSSMSYAQRAKCHAVHDTARGQIIFFFPTSGNECDTAVCWNYSFGVWYPWSPYPMASAVEVESSTSAAILLGGEASTAKGGYTYQLLSGLTFDGTAIVSKWMSGTIYGRLGEDTTGKEQPLPALPFTKRWRWVDILRRAADNTTLTVEWFPAQATDSATATGSKTLTAVSSSRDVYASRVLLLDSGADHLYDEGMRLRITAVAGGNGPWTLEGLSIGFNVLSGLKRRSP